MNLLVLKKLIADLYKGENNFSCFVHERENSPHCFTVRAAGSVSYFVPKIRSPASPKPGTI